LAAVAATASAQPGRGIFGGRSSSMLLTIPEVQKELNLNDDQKKQIETLTREAREKLRASFGQVNFQELQNLSAEEREKRVGEIRTKVEEAGKGIDEKVGKILDARQAKRLHQLWLQSQGAMALTRPEVIAKLGLTEEQQSKIKKIQADARSAGRPGFSPNQSAEERQAAMKKIRDQMEKAHKDSLAVLSDDQVLDWTNMCGKTFKFPPRQGPPRGNPPPPSSTSPQ
jgi:Spy/CpxP family protein refolding chaperone